MMEKCKCNIPNQSKTNSLGQTKIFSDPKRYWEVGWSEKSPVHSLRGGLMFALLSACLWVFVRFAGNSSYFKVQNWIEVLDCLSCLYHCKHLKELSWWRRNRCSITHTTLTYSLACSGVISPARALVGPQDRLPFGAYLDPFHHVGDKYTLQEVYLAGPPKDKSTEN